MPDGGEVGLAVREVSGRGNMSRESDGRVEVAGEDEGVGGEGESEDGGEVSGELHLAGGKARM
jgi:hypothetical protein